MTTEPKLRVVTLCGSTRFAAEIAWYERYLSLAGYPVFAYSLPLPGEPALSVEAHARLVARHQQMIDRSDEVHVVSNRTGYCGDGTRAEIARAERSGTPVRFVRVVRSAGRWEIEHAAGVR